MGIEVRGIEIERLAPLLPAIVAHAQAGWPEEVCGLVAEDLMIYQARNVSPTPRVAYELDPETLLRLIEIEDAGLALVAIYHSHPHGPETPSPTDIAQAYYPGIIHLIVSLADRERPVVRGFLIPSEGDH